jgi:uncharacterized repeat protein (TIGR03803 family)
MKSARPTGAFGARMRTFPPALFFSVAVLALAVPLPVRAQLTTLVELTGNGATNRGSRPSGLVLGHDGNFYGTTSSGGSSGCGTAFRMTPDGKLTTLLDFTGSSGANPGAKPDHGLIQAKDGNFYGTTTGQGAVKFGTVYRMTPDGIMTVLARLGSDSQGTGGVAGLIEGTDGNLYGTTFSGGSGGGGGGVGGGTVYRVTPQGQFTTMFNLVPGISDDTMQNPYGGLIQATDGNFYGTTWMGGGVVTGGGTVFRITPDGHATLFARLRGYSQNSTGGASETGLVQATDGNFYGVTPVFGRNNLGTVFKVTLRGGVSAIFNFTGAATGSRPDQPLIQGMDGALYGSARDGGTNDAGTLFRITTQGALTMLVNFTNMVGPDMGKSPSSPLLPLTDGSFMGTTGSGGSNGDGTIFQLKISPEMLAAAPALADAGSSAATGAPSMPSNLPPGVAAALARAQARTGSGGTPGFASPPAPEVPQAVITENERNHIPTVFNKLTSPDGRYSISMVDKPWLSTDFRRDYHSYHMLVLSMGDQELAAIPTYRELDAAYWSPDEAYVAVNNSWSDMGGDAVWVFAVPSGKVLKKKDDAIGKSWMKTGIRAVAQGFPITQAPHGGGKTFHFLSASGWQGDQLKFVVNTEEMYDDLEGTFDFNGVADPRRFPAITSSTLSMHGTGSLVANNVQDMTRQQLLLGWWAGAKRGYEFRDDGVCYAQGSAKGTSKWAIREGVYYENSLPYDIVSLTSDQFIFRSRSGITVTLHRVSEAEAEKM